MEIKCAVVETVAKNQIIFSLVGVTRQMKDGNQVNVCFWTDAMRDQWAHRAAATHMKVGWVNDPKQAQQL